MLVLACVCVCMCVICLADMFPCCCTPFLRLQIMTLLCPHRFVSTWLFAFGCIWLHLVACGCVRLHVPARVFAAQTDLGVSSVQPLVALAWDPTLQEMIFHFQSKVCACVRVCVLACVCACVCACFRPAFSLFDNSMWTMCLAGGRV